MYNWLSLCFFVYFFTYFCLQTFILKGENDQNTSFKLNDDFESQMSLLIWNMFLWRMVKRNDKWEFLDPFILSTNRRWCMMKKHRNNKPAIIENIHGWKHHKEKSAFEEVKFFSLLPSDNVNIWTPSITPQKSSSDDFSSVCFLLLPRHSLLSC